MTSRRLVVGLPVLLLAACATAGGASPIEQPTAGASPATVDARPATPPRPTSLQQAQQAFAEGRLAQSESLFLAAAATNPDDPHPHTGLASVFIAMRRLDDAVREADRSIALRETPEALLLRGRAQALARRFHLAVPDLERAVALDPRDATAWVVLAAVQVNRGDRIEVERALAGALTSMRREEVVNALWAQLIAIAPDPVQPQESLDRCSRGYVALLEGQPGEAEREASSGLRYSPDFRWCATVLAEARWRMGDVAGAEKILRAAVDVFPAGQAGLRADARGLLARVLLAQGGGAAEAADLARQALTVRGERAEYLDTLAAACEVIGDGRCWRDAYARLLALPHLPPDMRRQAEERLAAAPRAGNSP